MQLRHPPRAWTTWDANSLASLTFAARSLVLVEGALEHHGVGLLDFIAGMVPPDLPRLAEVRAPVFVAVVEDVDAGLNLLWRWATDRFGRAASAEGTLWVPNLVVAMRARMQDELFQGWARFPALPRSFRRGLLLEPRDAIPSLDGPLRRHPRPRRARHLLAVSLPRPPDAVRMDPRPASAGPHDAAHDAYPGWADLTWAIQTDLWRRQAEAGSIPFEVIGETSGQRPVFVEGPCAAG